MYKKSIVKVIISERISLILNETKITQTDLSKYLNVSQSRISEWKNGKGIPDITSYMNIWMFFGNRYKIPLEEWCQFHTNVWFLRKFSLDWINDFNEQKDKVKNQYILTK